MSAKALELWPDALRESVVAKALIAYTSISWLLLQIVSTFIQGLGLPDWVFSGLFVILLAGLPVLVLAVRTAARPKNEPAALQPRLMFGRLTVRRAALGGGAMFLLWALVVGGFMASWAFGIGPAASLMASGTLKRSDPVLISEFANRTRDPLLASTVTEAIRLDLSQSNLIRVVELDDVGDALERMNVKSGTVLDQKASRELAVREGMAGVLEGEVSSLGPATLISARLVNPRNGQTMAEYQERAKNDSELLDAVDRLSSTLRNKIGEPLTTLRVEPPLAEVTTASMPALRAYTEANAAHAAGNKGKAIGLLKTALSLDTSFPMAWRKLGALLGNDEPTAAREAYTNAYRQRANLPDRERQLATASYFKNVARDLPRAIGVYRGILASYPDDEVALNNLANLYTAFQRPLEAVKLQQRIIATRPRYAAYSNLFNSQIRLGRLDAARATHKAAASLFPDQKRIKFQPIILAMAAGDPTSADRLMTEFLSASRGKDELTNDLFVARYHWKRGRIAQAQAIFRNRAGMAAAKGKAGDAIESMTSLAAIARSKGKLVEGRTILIEALAAYPLDTLAADQRPYLDLAEAFAMVGDAVLGRHYLTLSDRHGQDDETFNYDQRARAEALIAMAEGKPKDAATILEKSAAFGHCSTCLLFDLGLAQEAAGEPRRAIATYRRYAKLAPFALGRGEQLGFVMKRLTNLHERGGDAQAAAATRAQLREIWHRADADLLADATSAPPSGG